MEVIENFQELEKINFQQHAGDFKDNREKEIYLRKDRVVRLYDAENVIKTAGNNLEFLQNLLNLHIDGVNTPNRICLDSKLPGHHYIISKYLKDSIDLEYFDRKTTLFEDILKVVINIFETLEKCHEENLYIFDIHSGNILVDSDLKPYFFDFDNSLFIKNDKLIFESKSTTFSDCMKMREAQNCFKRCYGSVNYLNNFYNANPDLLVGFYQQFDKEYTLQMILDIMYIRKRMGVNPYCDLDKNNIKKLGLSSKFTKKLITAFINGEPFGETDYFLDELKDLQGSRLSRKLNR